MRRFAALILLLAWAATASAAPREILFHDLEVRLDPSTAGLTATDRIRFGGEGDAGEGYHVDSAPGH